MPAPEGNQFWLARSKHGPNFKYDAETLWEGSCEYFQWVEDNPLWEDKPFNHQGEVIDNTVAKMRAFTMEGLYTFLDICDGTWSNYRQNNDLMAVAKKVDRIIYNNKFTGAAAGLLNPNIIARDLGLSDKQEVKQEVQLTNLTDEELDRKIKALEIANDQSREA